MLLTVSEVAKELRLHEETIKRFLRSGNLQGVKVGKVWRVKQDKLEEFLERGSRNVT